MRPLLTFATVMGFSLLLVLTVVAGLSSALTGHGTATILFSILGVGEVLVVAWYLDPDKR